VGRKGANKKSKLVRRSGKGEIEEDARRSQAISSVKDWEKIQFSFRKDRGRTYKGDIPMKKRGIYHHAGRTNRKKDSGKRYLPIPSVNRGILMGTSERGRL